MKKEQIKIALITLAVHSCYLFMFPASLHLKDPPQKKPELRIVTKEIIPPKTLAVKVTPAPLPLPLMHVAEKPTPTKPLATLPKNKDLPKKILKKKPSKQTPKQTAKPTAKPVKSVRGKLEKNVAKIQQNNTPTPPPLLTSSVATAELIQGDEKYHYLSVVSSQLQEWLILPEKGEVKLTITVQPNGKIANIKALSSESEKNLEYLKHVLEGVQLPVYDKNEEITFTVTFCDEK